MKPLQPLIEAFEIEPQTGVAVTDELAEIRRALISRIEELLRGDTEKLRWILYRIDIDEKKLYHSMKESAEEPAVLIADMIIARQMEKAESRRKFGGTENDWNFDV
ncbi:MAG: hypothetical protein U0T73_02915 [Chitinophagales bacterium]